jgi:hypothetical protein
MIKTWRLTGIIFRAAARSFAHHFMNRNCLIIFAIVCAAIIVGCSKKEVSTARPDLPVFSCDDTTDDGKFEQWTPAEREFLNPTNRATTYSYRDTPTKAYIKVIDQISRNILRSDNEFRCRIISDKTRFWFLKFILVDNVTGSKEGFANTYRPYNFPDDTSLSKLRFVGGIGLTPGCKRLYYYGCIDTLHDPNVGHAIQTNDFHSDVFLMGHFDITVN